MIGNTYLSRAALATSVVFMLIAALVTQAAQSVVKHPRLIEVFTTSGVPVTGGAAVGLQPDRVVMDLHDYELDGIQRIESDLSRDLAPEPVQSRQIVLQRIQKLDENARSRMQRAAMGLLKAARYGLDHYPAIVFDGEVAIYGVTDIRDALLQYQQWRDGGKQ